MQARLKPEDYLQVAIDSASTGEGRYEAIDQLPVPIYVTDKDGLVIYWNRACTEFAGREPELGRDRWCVTWQLYTTEGEFLPHAECPMAQAIREKRPVRGAVAIAMRPDGSRAAFTPYPTPLFDDCDNLRGAVNLLLDISDQQAEALTDQAARCRRLSRATHDAQAAEVLKSMASNYEETAAALQPK